MTEQTMLAAVMHPAEVEMLIRDLRSELVADDAPAATVQLARYHALLESFCKDWRQLYLLHGVGELSWSEFANLRDGVREVSKALGEGLVLRTNRVAAHVFSKAACCVPCSRPQQPPARPARRIRAVRSGPAAPRVHRGRAALRQHAVV